MTQDPKKYYGAFFWIALISFIVPVVVALKAFDVVTPTSKPTPNPDASGVDHALWDYLLKAYVRNGLIDYYSMARDHLFRTYLQQLGAATPEKLSSDAEQLALRCNAYNAFVINGVITHKITDSVIDYSVNGKNFFDIPEHILAGETMSLNRLEHEIIRVDYDEPRIHMALVCAAISCPTIRPEAYTGAQLDRQLEDQATLFANDSRYVTYDESIQLSPILQWYGVDWDNHGGVRPWLAERVRDAALKQALLDDTIKVTYNNYDWTLNTQGTRETSTAPKTDFGSGSIPNE